MPLWEVTCYSFSACAFTERFFIQKTLLLKNCYVIKKTLLLCHQKKFVIVTPVVYRAHEQVFHEERPASSCLARGAYKKIRKQQFTYVCASRGEHKEARATDAQFTKSVATCRQNDTYPSVMHEDDTGINGYDNDYFYRNEKRPCNLQINHFKHNAMRRGGYIE